MTTILSNTRRAFSLDSNKTDSSPTMVDVPPQEQPEAGPYMPPEILPPGENLAANSTHRLSRLDVQRAIHDVKRFVEGRLESDLHLVKVR
jgi:hypothetical protein